MKLKFNIAKLQATNRQSIFLNCLSQDMEEVDRDNIVEESEDIEEDIRTVSSVPMNPSDIIVLKFADSNRPGMIFYSLETYKLI